MYLLAAIIVYAIGLIIVPLYAAYEGQLRAYKRTVLAAAILWPIILVTFLGMATVSFILAFEEIRDAREVHHRSWPRIIGLWPVTGRIYKFFTRGK